MEAPSELTALLADIAEAKTRVRKAEAALDRAENDPEGTRDEMSAYLTRLNNMSAILLDLYEKEKTLMAKAAGERAAATTGAAGKHLPPSL